MKRQENSTILVGEDELEVREFLEMALKCLGYSVELAQDGDEVIQHLESSGSRVSAVLLNIMMPNGLETLKKIRGMNPQLPIIAVSGDSSPVNVVTAIRRGATDFLSKPVTHQGLQKALNKALENRTPQEYVPPATLSPVPTASTFLGNSRQVRGLQSVIKQIGWSEAPVLIQGETGSGKEVLARELHANSPRANKIFLKLNCAALPSELVESELFGYERGAFTGAYQKRAGMFEMANDGTLLLDEIGDMDVRLQAKLLQVLQDHEFQRIGGKEVIKVNVRIMAATHRDLHKAMADGTFREDLYYRLNVINVQLPPLREKAEDILPLAEFLLKKHAPAGTPLPIITPELRGALQTYHWPGNVRELENMVRKLIALGDAALLVSELRARIPKQLPSELPVTDEAPARAEGPKAVRQESPRASVWEEVKKAKRQTEADAIVAALDETRWNRKLAADLLQIDYKALLYKMKTLGVKDKDRIASGLPSKKGPQLVAAEPRIASGGGTAAGLK
jgi:two-component system, NtrC family, response regulator AtoC